MYLTYKKKMNKIFGKSSPILQKNLKKKTNNKFIIIHKRIKNKKNTYTF